MSSEEPAADKRLELAYAAAQDMPVLRPYGWLLPVRFTQCAACARAIRCDTLRVTKL